MVRGVALLALWPLCALAGTVSNCGGASDHLKNVVFTLSPDPVVKGQPFTFDLSGDLDEDLDAINIDAELNVKVSALMLNKHISHKGNLAITPTIPKGPFTVKVGPVSLKENIPGSFSLGGTISATDSKGEPVFCVQLGVSMVSASSAVKIAPASLAVESAEKCGKSTHVPDFSIATVNGVTTVAGTVDETVIDSSLAVDLTIKKWFFSEPISLNTKIHYEPGFPKGAFKFVLTPDKTNVPVDFGITVSGTAKLDDSNSQELVCLSIDQEALSFDEKVVTV